MNTAILQQFRTLLEHRRFELLVPLARADEEARASAEGPSDLGEQSTCTMSREFLFAQADANRRMLRRVEEALRRIREGAFGVCEHCGGEIPLARLKAIPWAKYCIHCQEELESDRQRIAA
jgi:RNA polymerase-binding transcription factor